MTIESWVLVTGGAQRIGAYLNKQFAKKNKNIVLHYHQSETAALTLKTELEREGINVVLWQADLTIPATITKSFSELLRQVPKIDLLINNASIFEQGSILKSSLAQIEAHMNVHLTSPWMLIQSFIAQNKEGQIINVLDANLTHKYTSKAAYFIAKKSLETLTELAAIECAPYARINAISPGFVLEAIDNDTQINHNDVNLLQRKVPLSDLYSAVEFLTNNSSITGQIIQIDGGSHLKCPQYMSKN